MAFIVPEVNRFLSQGLCTKEKVYEKESPLLSFLVNGLSFSPFPFTALSRKTAVNRKGKEIIDA